MKKEHASSSSIAVAPRRSEIATRASARSLVVDRAAMKCKTIQVLWHGKDPVLSVDFNPATGQLASCGTDREIKLWRVGRDAEGNPEVTHEDTLTASVDPRRRHPPRPVDA